MDSVKKALRSVREKMKPVLDYLGEWLPVIGDYIRIGWKYVMRFRKVILAVPVLIGSICMAVFSANHLPEYVGIDLQPTGEYGQLISKNVAVLGPLALTAVCLLLMFGSRRTLYPWLISLFSLLIPLLIVVINIFPA